MKVNCMKCLNEFEFVTNTKTLEGVDLIYAECDCGQRYLSFIVDQELKEQFLKTEHQLARAQNKNLRPAQRLRAGRKHRKLVENNRRLMHQKKAEYQYLIHQIIEVK